MEENVYSLTRTERSNIRPVKQSFAKKEHESYVHLRNVVGHGQQVPKTQQDHNCIEPHRSRTHFLFCLCCRTRKAGMRMGVLWTWYPQSSRWPGSGGLGPGGPVVVDPMENDCKDHRTFVGYR